jgi:hypothetical protein
VGILLIVAAFATILVVLTMANTNNVEDIGPMNDLKIDSEKVLQPDSDLSSENKSDPENSRVLGDATRVESDGPPDGGAAAWLVVLGAWCCAFSSPGWTNSMYFPSS